MEITEDKAYSVLDLVRLGEPGAEADLGEGSTGGQGDDLSEGHGVLI